MGNWAVGRMGNWAIGQLSSWAIGQLGNTFEGGYVAFARTDVRPGLHGAAAKAQAEGVGLK